MADVKFYVVVKHFNDATDNARYYPTGEKYPRENHKVTDERFKMLVDKGYLKAVKSATRPKLDNLNDLTVKELKALAKKKGVEYDAKAKKAELIALLKE